MPSATLATMTVAMFIEMPRKPMTPSTASTGSRFGAIVRRPNRNERKTRKITAKTVMNAVPKLLICDIDQVVIERAEQPARSGRRHGDAGARQSSFAMRVGVLDQLEHARPSSSTAA